MENNDLVRGVLAPALQAIFTGLLVSILMVGVCYWKALPWWTALISGGAAGLMSWFGFRDEWMKLISAILAPNSIEQPTNQPVRIELIKRDEGGYIEGRFIETGIDMRRLELLAEGLIQGKALTTASMTGPGSPFTRGEYERLRDELLTRGLLCQVGDSRKNGFALTMAGYHVMRRLATTPQPEEE